MSQGWRAGNKERNIALGVAAGALALIVAALVAPDAFRPAGEHEAPVDAPAPERAAAPSFHVPPPAPAPERQAATPPAPAEAPPPASTQPGAASHPLPARPKAEAPKAKPEPAARPAPRKTRKAESAPAAHGDWFVQVGAFQSRERARAMLRRIRARGFDGRIVNKAGGLHAVQAGPRESRAAAATLLHSLQLKAGLKGFIVHARR